MSELSELVQQRVERAGFGLISDQDAERIGRVCIAAAVDLDAALRVMQNVIAIPAGTAAELAAEIQKYAERTPTE